MVSADRPCLRQARSDLLTGNEKFRDYVSFSLAGEARGRRKRAQLAARLIIVAPDDGVLRLPGRTVRVNGIAKGGSRPGKNRAEDTSTSIQRQLKFPVGALDAVLAR
ncbi:MAG TPA: hypothetical protein VFW94_05295 [Candidatus Acidoferrales bacterium]|nr:hypothetical protein [Candidatus Acidoferrales bacterium]